MSTEVATLQESSLDLLPPAQPPSLAARQMLMMHAEMMQTAHQLAVAMCNTTMVPVRFRGKPDDGAAAILYGGELGLNPIQSLQRVIPIHGMPSMEARTMVALLKSRGYKVKTTAQSHESVTVQGWDLDGEFYESTWDIERAIRAGYVPTIDEKTGKYRTNKNGNLLGNEKYLTDPQAMLKAKAQAEVCREIAPDVLMGISYTSEELESERWDSSALPEKPGTRSSAPVTVDEILNATEPPKAKRQPAEPAQEPVVVEETEPTDDADGYDDNVAEAEPAAAADDNPEKPFQPDVTPDPEPVTAADPEPAPAAPAEPAAPKSNMRKALERRLFKLLAAAELTAEENREDRIEVYRAIIGRDDITSTDDLDDVETAAVADQLYTWDQAKELADKVTDILNNATLAQLSKETEGE